MADSEASRSGLVAVLDRLAGLEARQRDRSFETLRAAVLAGEEGAWKRFVEKYSRFTYTVALRLLSGDPDRDEAAAGIYVRVFDRLAARDHRILRDFGGRCRFTTYLFRMVQSERKEHYRRSRAVTDEPLGEREAGSAVASASDDPLLRSRWLDDAVRSALERLEPAERMLLLCRYRDGLKLREIAKVFGFRDTNVAARAVQSAIGRLDLLRALEAKHRLGDAEYVALERALREQLFRPGDVGDTEARR